MKLIEYLSSDLLNSSMPSMKECLNPDRVACFQPLFQIALRISLYLELKTIKCCRLTRILNFPMSLKFISLMSSHMRRALRCCMSCKNWSTLKINKPLFSAQPDITLSMCMKSLKLLGYYRLIFMVPWINLREKRDF